MRRSLRLLSCLCVLLAASCTRPPEYRPWRYEDLRLLDPVDVPDPAADILAVYTRTTALSVGIRVDLLDISPADDFTINVFLYDNGNFADRPLAISIPARGIPHTLQVGVGAVPIRPRVVRDYALDTVTISLNRTLIGDRFRVVLFAYAGNSASPVDEAGPARSDSLPPVNRAPLLLAFWDSFPAVTPAQALRRWDGAHTGPNGGRDGLKYLLEAAERHRLPIALLDLKVPASLAALDYLGVTPQLQDMLAQSLLILPEVAYADPAPVALDFSRRASAGFGLPASSFAYAATAAGAVPRLLPGGRSQFVTLADDSHLSHSGSTRLIPLPAADALEATVDGPALDVRRALARAATSADPADLVVLGGSLPHSTWGIPDMAAATFAWLAGHPWIQVLGSDDLQTFPLGPAHELPAWDAGPTSSWEADLDRTPRNTVTDLAWQAYLTLTAPTSDPALQRLRQGYLGQIGALLVAAQWAAAPSARSDCSTDLDGDGRAECVLANDHFFAVIELSGAKLTQLFYLDGSGPHQLIGPSSQFAVGLSDPSQWRPELGEAGDPSVIAGAFADETAGPDDYRPALAGPAFAFTGPDGSRVKTYRLTETGLEVAYQFPGPVTTRIPLALDPQAFYFGPTNYQAALTPNSWTWGPAGGTQVEVRTDAALSAQGFTASLPFMPFPENPNLNYPPGHYYPFPLSVVEVQGNGVFHVWISIK
jgi:hypothetical protein